MRKEEIDMLKGIPSILTPELLKAMMEMGHGDELVLADGNYPRSGHPARVIRCDGHGIPEILDAVLRFFPLDTYVAFPVAFMAVVPGDAYVPVIWDEYRAIVAKHEGEGVKDEAVGRFDFYARAREAYAAVTTGETALYANVILKKGVIRAE
jgi:L-fucose mutarotase